MNEMERARRDMALKTAEMSKDDKDSVSLEKLETSNIYTVGIRLDEALKHPGSDADIVLREGDKLIIPEYEGTVKISGDVMFANTVAFTGNKNYKWYVRQAGGFGQRAKKSKTYVIYPNGTMAMAKSGTRITPGCEIVVPSKPKKEAMTPAQWLGIGTGLASMASTIAMVIVYLTK
jgi:protein involved in polysaccharide export with SLBB domain